MNIEQPQFENNENTSNAEVFTPKTTEELAKLKEGLPSAEELQPPTPIGYKKFAELNGVNTSPESLKNTALDDQELIEKASSQDLKVLKDAINYDQA